MDRTRVLVVDDEEEFAVTLAERLRIRGYDAQAVYCPEDAVAIVSRSDFDVLLVDLKMPGMSGVELLRAAREVRPRIEVILLTGHLDLERVLEEIPHEHFDYILKPIDIAELVLKIEKARRRAAGEPEQGGHRAGN